jgi:hypothetical protein
MTKGPFRLPLFLGTLQEGHFIHSFGVQRPDKDATIIFPIRRAINEKLPTTRVLAVVAGQLLFAKLGTKTLIR